MALEIPSKQSLRILQKIRKSILKVFFLSGNYNITHCWREMACISLDSYCLWNWKAFILQLSIFSIALCQCMDYYLAKSLIFRILQESWRPHTQVFIFSYTLVVVHFPGVFQVGFIPLYWGNTMEFAALTWMKPACGVLCWHKTIIITTSRNITAS